MHTDEDLDFLCQQEVGSASSVSQGSSEVLEGQGAFIGYKVG